MWDIEIDVDGVLANMDGSYTPYIKHIIPDFSEEKYITGWGAPKVREVYPDAFEIIKFLWTDPDFFESLPRYPRVIEALKRLNGIINGKARVVIHTHVLNNGPVYQKRFEWLKVLMAEADVDFEIEISYGEKKYTRLNTKIIIEDNVTNLHNSNADYKILIRRAHNRDFNECDLGISKASFVVADVYDAVTLIEKILSEQQVA